MIENDANPSNDEIDKGIAAILEGFANLAEVEEKLKHGEVVDLFFKKHGATFTLRSFARCVKEDGLNAEQIKALAKELAVRAGVPEKNKWKFSTLHVEQDFIRLNLRELFADFEGSFACNDKAVHIMSVYGKSLETGEVVVLESQKFYTPELAVYSDWVETVDALISLHHGQRREYLRKLSEFEKFYRR